MDPYKILGITENADKEAISEAYRKLALQHHPDRGGDTTKFKEATEAYSILSDDINRQQYHNHPQDIRDFSFEDLFGRGFNPFAEFFTPHAPQPRQVQLNTADADIQFNLKINLEQVKRGALSTISYKRNKICTNCNGAGGKDRRNCTDCGGSGKRIFRPNPSTIQQIICPTCHGKGISFSEPCKACNTNGFVQHTEQITLKIKEEI